MNTKKTLWWLLLLFGEAILITAFILFRGNTPDNILTLNIIVSSLIYGLIFLNYQIPWIDLKDKSQKQIGALGISWFFTWFYAILAVAAMLLSNLTFELLFSTQLIIHAVLLFFLFIGIWLSSRAADKVKDVYEQETSNRNGIIEMKTEMRCLKDKINESNGLPANFTQRIDELEENLRFISPSDNSEAYNLERSFIDALNEIKFAISDYSMNEERIENNLKKLERIYKNRKEIYSN